jgi:hypothetical protein
MDDKVLLLIESEEYFATEDAPSLHEMIVGRRRILFGLLASADYIWLFCWVGGSGLGSLLASNMRNKSRDKTVLEILIF